MKALTGGAGAQKLEALSRGMLNGNGRLERPSAQKHVGSMYPYAELVATPATALSGRAGATF